MRSPNGSYDVLHVAVAYLMGRNGEFLDIVRLNDPPATITADIVETVDKADLADSSSRPDFGRPASKIAVGSNAVTLRNIETVVRWPAARLTADVRIWHVSDPTRL